MRDREEKDPHEDTRSFYYSDERHWLDELDELDDVGYYNDGFSGYQGPIYEGELPRAYDGNSAFDNSAGSWHSRNSFSYSRLANYSPSRLFRTTFLTSYGADSELLNRAISILRTLNRTANTIVDSGEKYVIQYGTNAEENSAEVKLTDSQERVIYVPAKLVEDIKTTDDEDAVVDALSGFVMSYVQIAQDVQQSTLAEINSNSMVHMVVRAVRNFIDRPDPAKAACTKEEREKICDTECLKTDYYAAILAKAMLMRLVRKKVVKNWGGFTPYFIKYAENITKSRAELEKAENTLENVVNKLAYNMIADETPLTLPEEIDSVLQEFFSEAVEYDDLLEVCRNVVIACRPHCINTEAEDKFDEILNAVFSQFDKVESDTAEKEEDKHNHFREALEAVAEDCVEQTEAQNEWLKEEMEFLQEHNDIVKKLQTSASIADTVRKLQGTLSALKSYTKTYSEAYGTTHPPDPDEDHASEFDKRDKAIINELSRLTACKIEEALHTINARPKARRALEAKEEEEKSEPLLKGLYDLQRLKETEINIKQVAGSSESYILSSWSTHEEAVAKVEKIIEALDETSEPKKDVAAAQDFAQKALEKLNKTKAALSKIVESLRSRKEKQTAIADKLTSELNSPSNETEDVLNNKYEALHELSDYLTTINDRINTATNSEEVANKSIDKVQEIIDKLSRSRTAGGVNNTMRSLTSHMAGRQFREDFGRLSTPNVTNWSSKLKEYNASKGNCHNTCVHTVATAMKDYETVLSEKDKEALVEAAVRAAESSNSGPRQKTDTEKLIDQIIDLLSDILPPEAAESNGEKSSSGRSEKQLTAIKKLLESLQRNPGVSEFDMRMTDALDSFIYGSHAEPSTKKVNDEVLQKLETMGDSCSVDEHLFGARMPETTMAVKNISHANNESKSDPEEDFVAYLSGCGADVKPEVITKKNEGKGRPVSSKICRGYETPAKVVRETINKYRGYIQKIKAALQFQAGQRVEDRFGLTSGDLDEGSLHKLTYDSEHIWSRKVVSKLPDVAVGILVDQSGSMSGDRIDDARTLCILLAEALRHISGVRLYVYGHTGNTMHGNDLTLYEHYTPHNNDMSRLGQIVSRCNNYDGYAIKEVAKRVNADPAKQKYLFVIADGYPAANGYGGEPGRKHVKSVCKYVRERLKMGLYAFAVDVAGYERKGFQEQYSEDKLVFVDDVLTCLPNIVRFLRNTLQKEKKLVPMEVE